MSFDIFGLLVVATGALSLFLHYRFSIYLTLCFCLFGAAAAVFLPALGGANIIVPTMFMLFFCLRVLRMAGPFPIIGALLPPSPGFWLAMLTLYGAFATMFYPRLMAGITDTMVVQRLPSGLSRISLAPLYFTSTHLTQTVYALGGLACFACAFAVFRTPRAYQYFLTGFFALCGLNLIAAVLDLATFATGTVFIMDFVRTASYSLLTNVEFGGLKRIAGTFSEASAFASFTLVLFAIAASLYLDDVRPRLSGLFTGIFLVLLALSTSATAYVGLVVVLAWLVVQSAAPVLHGGTFKKLHVVLLVGLVVAAVVLASPVLAPGATDAVGAFFNETLFGKLESEFGRERGLWNATAWTNFLESHLLGVGIGGARASSYLFVLLSNVGLPGLVCFVIFFALVMFRRPSSLLSPEEVAVVRATRCGLVASLVAALLVSGVYDMGVLYYFLSGVAAASAVPMRAHARQGDVVAQPAPDFVLGRS